MIINISGVTSGQAPYDVYICDETNTSCFYVSGLTNIPPSVVFDTEDFFPFEQVLNVKIIDTNGCVHYQNIVCGQKIFQDTNLFIFMDGNNYMFQ
jgi:hypothetical protein